MFKSIVLIAILFLLSCNTTSFFIVRHAEKETATTMTTDVPLSEAGRQRAGALKELLKNENIQYFYYTNYIRTKATAQPLAEATGNKIEVYDPNDSLFAGKLKSLSKGNVLVVGHSNTVDDIV